MIVINNAVGFILQHFSGCAFYERVILFMLLFFIIFFRINFSPYPFITLHYIVMHFSLFLMSCMKSSVQSLDTRLEMFSRASLLDKSSTVEKLSKLLLYADNPIKIVYFRGPRVKVCLFFFFFEYQGVKVKRGLFVSIQKHLNFETK